MVPSNSWFIGWRFTCQYGGIYTTGDLHVHQHLSESLRSRGKRFLTLRYFTLLFLYLFFSSFIYLNYL